MSNLIIVEATNDATFIKAIVKYLNDENETFYIDIDSQTGYIPLEFTDEEENKEYRGLSEFTLTKALERIKVRLSKESLQKIGIILDRDRESKENRLKLVNKCIKNAFVEAKTISDTHQLVTLTTIDTEIIQIACYFLNVDGQGELETLLRRIKHHDSSIADCLENCLKECLKNNPKDINQKNLDKKWVDHYLRYDTCHPKEKKDANKKCSFNKEGFEYVMQHKPEIWNFNHTSLTELKTFLQSFNQT